MKNYFTLGQNHTHRHNGITLDCDIVIVIEATDADARARMFELFGDKWSMHYTKEPDMSFFPRGFVVIKL